MSQADIEMLRAAYEAFSRGDRIAAFGAAHPDLEKVLEAVGLPERDARS